MIDYRLSTVDVCGGCLIEVGLRGKKVYKDKRRRVLGRADQGRHSHVDQDAGLEGVD